MPYCVAFLRAINVGGRFLKMAALAEHCRALGLADVQTYINSGNVIFLPQPLTPEQSTALTTLCSDIDDFDCAGTELFWLCRRRQSDSKFSNAVLERKLGLRCTLRRASMLQGLSQQLRTLPP